MTLQINKFYFIIYFINSINKVRLIVLLISFINISVFSQSKLNWKLKLNEDKNKILVAAHRGDWKNFPENSIEGVKSCIDRGVDIIEIDVHKTKDGHFILMHDESVLFIQTSQANMVINNEFDTIYHEHLSFFNTNSMKVLVEKCGLFLSNVFKTDIHGTSYVFVITKNSLSSCPEVEKMLNFEKENGLFNILTYPQYALKCYTSTFELKNKLEELKKEDYLIIGYGAAAKGNTLLNFGKIDLDFIIDDNPLKQNLYTPGRNIKIVSSDFLLTIDKNKKVAFIPLAWNFYDEIKKRIKNKRDNTDDIFIKYFPNLTINK